MIIGAGLLLVSLFLTWSHQFSAPFLAEFGQSSLLSSVPRDPNAWQVYSAADVLLALLAAAVILVALIGGRGVRLLVLAGAGVALVFTLHALSHAPTSGANIFNPSASVPSYVSTGATAGAGETVALIALALAIFGLLVSFTAD